MTSSVERIVLVGFMAAGKTTVGRLLAEALDWQLIDLDQVIERRAGRSVRDIFAGQGEAVFRRLEAEATAEVAGRRRVVLTPGGGWIQQPELLEQVRPGSAVVWLKVSVAEALRRSRSLPGVRPLLAGPDPGARAASLLLRRRPLYERADVAVETDSRTPMDVTREILEVLKLERRAHGGKEG